MSEWVKVADAGDVAEGEINSYTVGTRMVAVANVDGDLQAFDDTCTHQGCSLSEGDLLVTMGAGNIWEVADETVRWLGRDR